MATVPTFQVLAPRGQGVRLPGTGKDISLGNGWLGVFVAIYIGALVSSFFLLGLGGGLITTGAAGVQVKYLARHAKYNVNPLRRRRQRDADGDPDPTYFR